MTQNDISIVLTGTIIPNTTNVTHNNVDQRREEYLDCIRYYMQFGKVYFLENSTYDVSSDPFFSDPGFELIKIKPSDYFHRGKGFQEFEMIDSWVHSGVELPSKWIKVTGRYKYMQFHRIIDDVQRREQSFVIDQFHKSKTAFTGLFYTTMDFYKSNMMGIYAECNDATGDWIEKVLYKKLRTVEQKEYRCFSIEPLISGISGTTGRPYGNDLKHQIKRIMRKVNLVFNNKMLYWRNI